jgi:hypothetical protein
LQFIFILGSGCGFTEPRLQFISHCDTGFISLCAIRFEFSAFAGRSLQDWVMNNHT